MRGACGPGCQQPIFNAMQAFPCGLGERWVRADDIPDHLPGSEVERAFGRRPHGKRDAALRAETDPLRGRFLARTHPHSLREKIDGNRFLSGLEFAIATKAE